MGLNERIGAPLDSGTGYERKPSTYLKELTEVGRGTPMGELLRRYWHPVALSTDATTTPKAIRMLGEDLILFRDKTGRPGLLYARCCHRGTTLYYGRVDERGIRCCYHGWLFDVEGQCLERPCEANADYIVSARQPWYPVRERYGLIFAYMGPPAKKPALPRFEALEILKDGELLEPHGDSFAAGGGHSPIIPCNWTHQFENVLDPFHVPILHGSFSGPQFNLQMASMPNAQWDLTDKGVKVTSTRTLDSGKIFRRVTEAVLPTVRVVPNPFLGGYGPVEKIGWMMPIDDTHYRIYTVFRVKEIGEISGKKTMHNGKAWEEMTEAEHQAYPDDYEAQVGQGPITLHSEEHLSPTDRGIVMLRRLYREQLKALDEGRDPIGVTFDDNAPPVRLEAGNYIDG
jgi:phenylpropionate dioxygenase-like ring-hydroxylating dioxygenase large terminal subunit